MSRNFMDFGGLERELEDEAYREEVREERRELMATLVRVPCHWCATRGCANCAGYGFWIQERP